MPTLCLPISHLDPAELQERKAQLLSLVGLGENIDCRNDEGVPDRAVWRARVLCMDEIELYAWCPFGVERPEVVEFVSHWNELKTVRMLRTQIDKMEQAVSSLRDHLAGWCQRLTDETDAEPGNAGEKHTLLHGADWDALQVMLAEGGMKPQGVAPAVFPDTTGRGLVFTRDVAPPEPIVAIPRALLFNVEATYPSSLHPIFESLGLDNDTRLLLFLMHEKFAPTSSCGGKWAPFIKLLPAAYSTLFFWNTAELAELQGSRLLGEAMEQKTHLQGIYDSLFPRLSHTHPDAFPAAVFTFENMLWARAVFDSRAFVINIEGKPYNCLLPYAEYINHTPSAGHVSFRRFDAESQTMLLESLGRGQKGTQARMNYGPMQNSDLLLGYGFAIDDNPLETAVVNIDLSDEEDPLLPFKTTAISKLNIPSDHLLGTRAAYHYFLAVLRIFHCESPEQIAHAVSDNACLKGPIDEVMEGSVLETFAAVIEGVLAEYPTTVEDDEALLAMMRGAGTDKGNHTEILATPNLEFALVYRIGQKKVLRQAISWAAGARAALS